MVDSRYLRAFGRRLRNADNDDDNGNEAPLRTPFSRLHPYPAMVGDDLAFALCREYVLPGARLIDPFCGSGKFLTAAPQAAVRVGIDVNPLAWLVTTAKLTPAKRDVVEHMLHEIRH